MLKPHIHFNKQSFYNNIIVRINEVYAAIDIGSFKLSCIVSKIKDGQLKTIAMVQCASYGIKNGTIIDIEQASNSIQYIIELAEKEAGYTIGKTLIGISGLCKTINICSFVNINDKVSKTDVKKMLKHIEETIDTEYVIVHKIINEYIVDGIDNIQNPTGMFGKILACEATVIVYYRNQVENLAICLEKSVVDVIDIVSNVYAGGMLIADEDDKKIGSIVMDIGHEITSLAIFYNGSMIYSTSIAIAGKHITNDIAHILSTDIEYAEKIKLLYSEILVHKTSREKIPNFNASKELLSKVVLSRIEEIFDKLYSSIPKNFLLYANRMFLIGGGSKMSGLREWCNAFLCKTMQNNVNDEENNYISCFGMINLLENYIKYKKRDDGVLHKFIKWVKNNMLRLFHKKKQRSNIGDR